MDVLKVQWFPGHMAKTRRLMESNLKLVDVVVELVDARIPQSSRNPEIDKIIGNKPRVILLNKCDIANMGATKKWIEHFKKQGIPAVAIDCKNGRGLSDIEGAVKSVLKDELEKRERKGNASQPIRMMIVGIPNVGKSSLINKLAGSKKAKVEDRPGVTRGKQWVKLENGIELLDMPGVLWPKFEDPLVGEKLAFIGSVKDDVIDVEYMAMRLLYLFNKQYPDTMMQRYKINEGETDGLEPYDLLELVGKKRGMLISGGQINTERAAITVMDEYRQGLLGKITLEFPED